MKQTRNVQNKHHPLEKRIESTFGLDKIKGKWLTDLQSQDLTNPAIAIINGWQAEYLENKWYADALSPDISTYAFDSRGQGRSIKEGPMDITQGAIDTNFIINNAFDKFDEFAKQRGKKPGNKLLEGHCLGAMTIATIFATKLPLKNRIDATILTSPTSNFDLSTAVKISYFLPEWLGRFGRRYLAEPIVNFALPDHATEKSKRTVLQRLQRIDPGAAIRQAKAVFWKGDVSDFWKHIDVPTLILTSPNDRTTPIEKSAKVYEELPYPIWFELEAPDHLILEDNIGYLKEQIPKFANDPWKFYEQNIHLSPS